ncbi:MAG: hypothetical protein K2X61_09495 [Caulobacteraceae bacterium]|nr:hypothetical protein [Caulobacteraceae bacterium]
MSEFTLETLREAVKKLDALPPVPQLFSYSLWPQTSATVIEHEEGRRIFANPAFWRRCLEADTNTIKADILGYDRPFMGLPIIDLDLPANRQLRVNVMLDLVARLHRATDCETLRPDPARNPPIRPESLKPGP